MNSFGSRSELKSGNRTYEVFSLSALAKKGIQLERLPYSLRILLENLLRHEDGKSITADDIEFLATWDAKAEPSHEIAYMPARVLMQDFTGVPAVVDLAAMRDAVRALGGDPEKINPLQPAELVIDHSVQVDQYGTSDSYSINVLMEYRRNRERYAFLKWGQTAFHNFSVVPPGMGICHQVNLEYLARVAFTTQPDANGLVRAYPDTLVGTDSHTTMINGLGVLGWGVGGIEAEGSGFDDCQKTSGSLTTHGHRDLLQSPLRFRAGRDECRCRGARYSVRQYTIWVARRRRGLFRVLRHRTECHTFIRCPHSRRWRSARGA